LRVSILVRFTTVLPESITVLILTGAIALRGGTDRIAATGIIATTTVIFVAGQVCLTAITYELVAVIVVGFAGDYLAAAIETD